MTMMKNYTAISFVAVNAIMAATAHLLVLFLAELAPAPAKLPEVLRLPQNLPAPLQKQISLTPKTPALPKRRERQLS